VAIEPWLWGRIARQLLAAAAMAAALWLVREQLEHFFAASAGKRLLGVAALVSAGGIVYFAVAWVIGAMDKEDLLILLRRKKAQP
jgi:putative peptidoglycan lipid II flippase